MQNQILISMAMAIRAALAVNNTEKMTDERLAARSCAAANAMYREFIALGWVENQSAPNDE